VYTRQPLCPHPPAHSRRCAAHAFPQPPLRGLWPLGLQ